MVEREESAGLYFTGHALVDVGIAGLCAFANRTHPEQLTMEDLDRAADFMVENYYSGKLGPFLSCVFMNSSFVQPKEDRETTEEFIRRYVRAHRSDPEGRVAGLQCAFSGGPATSPLVRTHLPMFSAEGVINFRPDGQTFVPVAGPFIVALMFLPLAGRRAEGRLLAVHSEDPALTLRFARRYLTDNRRLLAATLPTDRAPFHAGFDRELPMWDAKNKRYKFADAKGPRSLVISDLAAIAAEALPTDRRPRPVALTVYLLSNSGQGPSLEMFDVPSTVVSFIAMAAGAGTRSAWESIARRFKPLSGEPEPGERTRKKSPAVELPPGRAGWSRNPAFEDLYAIFAAGFTDRSAAAAWLRRHVLGRLESRSGDVRFQATRARCWALASLFLEEVLGMKPAHIETIRTFSDKLAEHIARKNDRDLFRALTIRPLREVRHSLLRAQRATAGGKLLFGLDEYAQVFLHGEDDEYLVRDLICVRVVEELSRLNYFAEHPDVALPEDNQEGANGAEEVTQ